MRTGLCMIFADETPAKAGRCLGTSKGGARGWQQLRAGACGGLGDRIQTTAEREFVVVGHYLLPAVPARRSAKAPC
jgi:hypothetical protein